MTSGPTIIETCIHPVKGMGGQQVNGDINRRLPDDRRFAVATPGRDGEVLKVINPRTPGFGPLVTACAEITPGGFLKLTAEHGEVTVPMDAFVPAAIEFKKHLDPNGGVNQDRIVGEWLADLLGRKDAYLVEKGAGGGRTTTESYQGNAIATPINLADNVPLHLIAAESLKFMQIKLGDPAFNNLITRANVVVEGLEAMGELALQKIRIGGVTYIVNPTPRCVVITYKSDGTRFDVDPLRVLADYAKGVDNLDNKPFLGVYLQPVEGEVGTIRVGDGVSILEF